MKTCGSIFLFLVAIALFVSLFFGDDSYAHMKELEKSLVWQQKQNDVLVRKVDILRRRVIGLQNDPRSLERAARDELGMARADELVIMFEKRQ